MMHMELVAGARDRVASMDVGAGKRGCILIILVAVIVSGCRPTIEYRLPETLPAGGPFRPMGTFTIQAGGCGSYTIDGANEDIIQPALRDRLAELHAVTADHVEAKEHWVDIPLGLLIVPALLGCSNWVVTGEALAAERSQTLTP